MSGCMAACLVIYCICIKCRSRNQTPRIQTIENVELILPSPIYVESIPIHANTHEPTAPREDLPICIATPYLEEYSY